jgi:hypothetical protein
MTGIKDYSTTAASNTMYFPENMAPSLVNDNLRQVQADIRNWYEQAEWLNLGFTPTYVSTTSFTVSGDKTSYYTVGRRIKIEDATTLYGVIAASTYLSPNTTVTVTLDSGVLSTSISSAQPNIIKLATQSINLNNLALTGTTSLVNMTVSGLATFTDIKVIDSINDTNNNEVIILGSTASAVNEITITNAATGSGATIASTGGDTNRDLNFQVGGTGAYNFKATSTTASKITGYEQTTNGTNALSVLFPTSLASDISITLPSALGSNGDLLGANASGVLSFVKGNIIDRAYAEYTAYTDLNTILPIDDTIPQVTEGTQILSASITPKSTTNRIRIRVQGSAVNTASAPIAIAAFVNGGTNAVAATFTDCDTTTIPNVMIGLEYEYVAGSTSTQTITIRAGSSSVGTRFNGNTTTRLGGGTARTTLILEEITA